MERPWAYTRESPRTLIQQFLRVPTADCSRGIELRRQKGTVWVGDGREE